MKMKSKVLFFLTVIMIMSALSVAVYTTTAPITGRPGFNLNGKMFTLSTYRGGICFYSPYQHPPWYSTPNPSTPDYNPTPNPSTPDYNPTTNPSTPYYNPTTNPSTPYYNPTTNPSTPDYNHTTNPSTPDYNPTTNPSTPDYNPTTNPSTPDYNPTTNPSTPYYSHTTKRSRKTTHRTYTTTTYPPRTTVPSTRGVSVCLRYITDYLQGSSSIFTFSPYSTRLRLSSKNMFSFSLTFNDYNTMYLIPNIRVWSDFGQSLWTSVCLTVDSTKGVVQMFKNTNMSMRKMLPSQYVWYGESVIDFTGFDGQVTDVEVWDYPLRYKQVFYYMSRGIYGSYQGSLLTWSYISYSLSGNTLLEDSYEQQLKQPANRVEGGRRGKGKKMLWKFLNKKERNEIKEQMI